MKTWPQFLLLCTLALAAGCASQPQQAVELSATIGRDLAAVHTANRNLAQLHFATLLADVDRFVDEVYRPFIIEFTVADLDLVADFEAALAGRHELELDALDVLVVYSEEVTARIDTFRTELRAPLESQRDSVLQSIDAAFRQLQTANAVVTGHLASIVKVQEAQDALLRDLGLGDYRARVGQGLAGLAGDLDRVLDTARRVDGELAEVEDRLERARLQGANLSDLPDLIRALTTQPADPPADGGTPDE